MPCTGNIKRKALLNAGRPLILADRQEKAAVRRQNANLDNNTVEFAKGFRSPEPEAVMPPPETKADL